MRRRAGSAERRLTCLGFAVLTVGLGLSVRFGHLGLPAVVVKYGGSALWAAMLYWLSAGLVPGWRPLRVGLLAGTVAGAVECFKLLRAPALDAFRLTLAGKLLLGRFFSGWDLVAYAVGILLAIGVDLYLES